MVDMSSYTDIETMQVAAAIAPPNSPFHEALKIAETYTNAGLTPIFSLDYVTTTIYVTTEEFVTKKYH